MGKISPIISSLGEKAVELGLLIRLNALFKESVQIVQHQLSAEKDANDELVGNWEGESSSLYQQITIDRENVMQMINRIIEGMGNHAESFELDYIETNEVAGDNT